ncbi:hypothetical protein PIROE2DRAFT_14534 [Piromyces sp. E2]|nr:hypothetical protein PIROE2DRAFT_14534 [Piromyces sp. E2]|eukprot:OUM59833.1 hypothetical protein PIROE2DRAFT_14534 [Piromyces sp. E2]
MVVTVSSYLNDTQRQVTIDAKSTAAALAYGLKNRIKAKEYILLIKFGKRGDDFINYIIN